MQDLQQLNGKIDQLLKKYAALQAENKLLKETLARQLESIEELNGKLATLEESMTAVTIGKSVVGDADREHMRKQLDNVIGEIDKILGTLND